MKKPYQILMIAAGFIAGFFSHGFIKSKADENFKIAKIIDGDSLKIANLWQTEIRLNAIDTPEKGRPFFDRAADKLQSLCLKTKITLKNKGDGGFGRISADVYCDNLFVNPIMIEAGMAIISIQHAKDMSLYALQDEARENCRGIWSNDVTIIYDIQKLEGRTVTGETVKFTNNPDCIIKQASN